MEDSKRMFFLDNLRTLMIFLVLVLHITIASIVPQFPGWVHDPAPSAIYLYYIMTITDGPLLMAVMFFLAGYFTLSSFARKGAQQFIRDKMIRLGIPFVAGASFIAYLLGNIAYYAGGGKGLQVVSVATFFQWLRTTFTFFNPKNYGQYYFWFIGVLLWFYLLTALVLTVFKRKISPGATKTGRPSVFFFIGFTVLTILASFAVSLTGRFYSWTVTYFIEFQNMFLPVYIAYFILGMYAYKRNWFKDEYRPRILPWTISYIIAMAVHTYLFGITYLFNPTAVIPKLLASITYNISIISWLFMLLALFQKYFNKETAASRTISGSSYGVYLIHGLVLFGVIIVTRMIPIPQIARFILNIVLVTLFAWGISYGLKKVPGFRRVL